MAELLRVLEDFGARFIESGRDADEPELEVSPDEMISLFAHMSDSRSLQIGIANVMWRLIDDNFEKISQQQRHSLRCEFMRTFQAKLDELSLEGLADAAIQLHRKMNEPWPELETFLFTTTPRPAIVGPLFVRFMSTTNFDFVKSKSDDIIHVIDDMILTASFQVKTAMIILLARLDETTLIKYPDLFEKMWEAALQVVSVDGTRAAKLYIPFDEIYKNETLFAWEPKCVSKIICELKDNWESAKCVLKFLPYLPLDSIQSLFEKLRAINSVQLTQLIYDEAPLADIPEPTLQSLLIHYRKQNDDANLAIYAALAAVVSDMSILEEILHQSSVPRLQIALKALEYMSDENNELDFSPPVQITDRTIEMLHANDPIIRNAAFDAIKALIINDVFVEPANAKQLVRQFEKLHPEDIPKFFDLLATMSRVDAVEVEVVETIFDFAYITIRSDRFIPECISLFNTISETSDGDMVECVIDDLLPLVQQMIKTNELQISLTALIHYVVIAPEVASDAVHEMLPMIKEIAKTNKDDTIRALAGRLWAAAAGEYKIESDYQELENLMEKFLVSRDENLIMSASMMGCSLVKQTKPFELLRDTAMKVRNTNSLNVILKSLRKFLKEHEGLDPLPLANLFLTERHPVFNRKPASAFSDTNTQIYTFLTAVESDRVEPTLLKWFTEAPFPMISCYLVALEKLKMTKEYYAGWAKTLSQRMMNTSIYLQEIILGFILNILHKDKTALDLDFFASQLVCLWNKCEDEEPSWQAAVGTAILEVCAMGAEMDDDIVEDILADYPFDALYGNCEVASEALVEMMDSGKWEYISAPVALCFMQVLTMSVQKMKKYKLTENTRKEMTRVVRQIFAENPAIERMSRDQLGANETLLKRFEVLTARK